MKNIKKRVLLSYISSDEKFKLVGSFVIENFWNTFIEHNKESISIYKNIAKNSILDFIKVYQDVWDYVEEINILDDIFLSSIYNSTRNNKNLSITELKIGLKLLALSLYSELEKDCLMALNKTLLNELSEDIRKKYNFDAINFQLLMTPSFETFFTAYHVDHLEYKICNNQLKKQKIKNNLVKKYHCNDNTLFDLRFNTMYFPESMNLKVYFNTQKKLSRERSIRKLEFIGDKKDLLAFEKLLEYDNFLDFKYRYNLQACPEFFLRKLLFSECKQRGIFKEIDKPLQLDDQEFIKGVIELITTVEKDSVLNDVGESSASFCKAINKSIKKFIERKPYLKRSNYEMAFKFNEHHNIPGN